MEVIDINGGRMVFLLDREDTEKYHITGSSDSLKEGYCRLITDTGIDRSFLSDVTVQIFDSKSGGCEMFVTRLPDGTDSSQKGSTEKCNYIYTFSQIEDMLLAISYLQTQEINKATAYRDKKCVRYFLSINTECRYLSEFLAVRSKNILHEYLSEHCSIISNDAVKALSPLV